MSVGYMQEPGEQGREAVYPEAPRQVERTEEQTQEWIVECLRVPDRLSRRTIERTNSKDILDVAHTRHQYQE